MNVSRDGKWVTYVAYPESTVWRSKVDGSERLQLTFPPLFAILPRWSPDGTQITFMALEPGTPWSLYVISADGGTPEQLTPGDEQAQTGPRMEPHCSSAMASKTIPSLAP